MYESTLKEKKIPMKYYINSFILAVLLSNCSIYSMETIENDDAGCGQVSDEEADAIIEYLMQNYREQIATHPAFFEYCENQMKRIEQEKEQ